MNTLNLANNITRLRHDRKITQEQLAAFIGVTKASVSKWENGQSTPDILILPQLATFFDVTIDELIGYTPQLSKEQIQELYQRFGKAFSERPFDEVMAETESYVKRYYSCYPFLLQMCVLWLNHCPMAETEEKQKDVCLRIEKLCQHIKAHCNNMKIYGNVIMVQSMVNFQLGRLQEAVEDLEDFSSADKLGNLGAQSMLLLAQAYTLLGSREKAVECSQISMYGAVMNLLANAGGYLSIHMDNPDVCEETIDRIERVAEIYQIAELNPNVLAVFEYQASLCYLAHGKTEKALNHMEKYVVCLSHLFSEAKLQLHGDAYFDRVENWFEKELDNGPNAPRDRKIVLEDARKTLDATPFAALNGNPEFEKIKNKLKELN